jgi:hypothetical protein
LFVPDHSNRMTLPTKPVEPTASFQEPRASWLIGLVAVLFFSALLLWTAPWRGYSDLHSKMGDVTAKLVSVTWEPRLKAESETPRTISPDTFPNREALHEPPTSRATLIDNSTIPTTAVVIGPESERSPTPPEPFRGSLRNCVSGTNLILFGHSHVRYLYEALCQRFAQFPELAGSIPHGTCEKRSVQTRLQFRQWNDLRFHFLSSPFWEVDDSTWDDLLTNNLNSNGPIHILFARGAWDLIYNNTEPIDFYTQSVERLGRISEKVWKMIKSSRGRKRTLQLSIYLSHYYHQPTKVTYQRCALDSRNEVYRVLTKCAAAEVSRLAAGSKPDGRAEMFKFLDVYSWTKTLARQEADGWGHHYNQKITNSIVDQYLSEIVCPPESSPSLPPPHEGETADNQSPAKSGATGASLSQQQTRQTDCPMNSLTNETLSLWSALFDQRLYRNCTCHRAPFGVNCPVWAQFVDSSAKSKLMKEKVRREILTQLCEEWGQDASPPGANIPSLELGQGIAVELCAPRSKESLRGCLRQVPGLALAELAPKLQSAESTSDPAPGCNCKGSEGDSQTLAGTSDDCAHRLKRTFCLREPIRSHCRRWLPQL